ncbi:hypothetical protein APY94_06630 [Thermococcus celericrescens]|uniref:Restriction endonuclease type IV Mrr domain-containing protein n=1 Tax=Thermococcus celericrescens TaxID=227598 RepID=A0A117ITR8_9EURY|nr:restriction endonuclease [Thermococcus celericrescens]KUH33189.1 hypothetical protein APY94_06630 [Thermococcus celericrescens]
MNPQKKGYSLERAVAEALQNKGFKVILTPASGDFGADIIAEKDGRKIAIQVKNTKDKVGVKAIQEVLGGKEYYKCHEAWVVSKSGFTRNAWELADRANVKLIHADELVASGDKKREAEEVVIEEYLPHNDYGSYVSPYLELAKISVILFLVLVLYFSMPKVPDNLITSTNTTQVPEQEQLKLLLPTYEILEIPNRTVLFFDNFEKYETDYTMGQQNGWFPIWGWSGKSFEQKVVADVSVSGNKSFQLWGDSCRSAGYHRYLYFDGKYLQLRKMNSSIGFETYIGIEGYGNPKCGDKFEDNATTGLLDSGIRMTKNTTYLSCLNETVGFMQMEC